MLITINSSSYFIGLDLIFKMTKLYHLLEISDHLLKRKIDLCHELLELADKLEPDWSAFRGKLLLDLQAAMTMQTKREFETEKLTKAGAQVSYIFITFKI